MRAHSPTAAATERWRPVPATPSPVRLSLPARARNIAVVRRALEAVAEELALPRRLVEDMRLAVTEACTNVVRHASTATARPTVRARCAWRCCPRSGGCG